MDVEVASRKDDARPPSGATWDSFVGSEFLIYGLNVPLDSIDVVLDVGPEIFIYLIYVPLDSVNGILEGRIHPLQFGGRVFVASVLK